MPVIVAFDPATDIDCLTFNRPDVPNAIDVPTARAANDGVRSLVAEPGLRCIVLAGTGRAFVAGGDIVGQGSQDGRPARMIGLGKMGAG